MTDDEGLTDERQQLLIVTGMSGAGRSTACKALEDLDWFVVDNLPPEMITPLIEVAGKARDSLPKLAVAMDVRGGRLLESFTSFVVKLRQSHDVRVIFLDATDDTLVRRFESVRRPHPLQGDGTILEGIEFERARLREVRESADIIIDTSALNVHQLAKRIIERFGEPDQHRIAVTVMSFGFKYGMPTDADMVADVRFLPNPFWEPDLRAFTGRDKQVSDYVLAQEGAEEFVDAYVETLEPVFHGYERENKRHATIAIGCTGGKHRSVAMTEHLAQLLRGNPELSVTVRHRDLGRE
ncbi:nucleotide-binding protein [Pseudoclavibacter endophyticus]|uniref:RNase adapter RapZ n=1 Tax=Pseudoclavibacter endophyticus TaxID=1778590 RepID=A0A6H9WVB2_9MICO|nr:RNase adapter RapZ [Pseudoclavibacter endophyticus]KAB1650130.1 RNase adapter RapZ [Pseudoclavibacter endophyticus]GGA56889.1 nucleotide-binding protein [Pseudoclavibacter endophyticus]